MPVELVTEIVAEIYPLPPVLHWLRLSQTVSPHESLGHCLYLMPERLRMKTCSVARRREQS